MKNRQRAGGKIKVLLKYVYERRKERRQKDNSEARLNPVWIVRR